ncbi:MAG TPA: outer membrane lipoprotein carrier protein LolA [Thermoanaerobaculia bacterium]|nr:outer membrane lipoprotein carrier protein LolA [Thermoanaerobaculia bacterium]
MLRLRRAALAAIALAAVASALDAQPASIDPWSTLEQLRRALSDAGPLRGDFVQTYTPAGFASGETESGRIAASLPDCMRWDYLIPYRKSFLVCGSRAWSWVEGEPSGRRITIDARNETGLDLLLLRTGELDKRYRAQASRLADGGTELTLEPLDSSADLVVANLSLTPGGERISALDYRDREGNVTSFRFSNWMPLADAEGFAPPAEVEWTDP